jgi:ABC-type multidrug transport system ATPase subunit
MALQLTLNNVGKSYNFDWIFRGLSLELSSGQSLAVLGGNGSGKSTFLKMVAGSSYASEGTLDYTFNGKKIDKDDVYSLVSLCAPYQSLFDDFTLAETIAFQAKFKPFVNGLGSKDIIELIELPKAANKALKYYSSGMKQRAKLAMAILADTPLLLLDEPGSNLDKKGVEWFKNLLLPQMQNRLVMVCSNRHDEESGFCQAVLEIEQYKKKVV